MAKDNKEVQKEPKKVTRYPYQVLHRKNFGEGFKNPGETVELSAKAGEHYKDLGFVKPIKTK